MKIRFLVLGAITALSLTLGFKVEAQSTLPIDTEVPPLCPDPTNPLCPDPLEPIVLGPDTCVVPDPAFLDKPIATLGLMAERGRIFQLCVDTRIEGSGQPPLPFIELVYPITPPPEGEDLATLQAFFRLERLALDELMVDHEIPASDELTTLYYARDYLRARIFNELVGIAKLQDSERSPDDQRILDAYAPLVQKYRLAVTETSRYFYYEWLKDPLTFIPPEGFVYTPNSACFGGLGGLFEGCNPPSFEELQSYGASVNFKKLRQSEPAGASVVARTARGFWLLGGLAAAALAFEIGIVVVLALGNTLFSTLAFIFPYSVGYVSGILGGLAAANVGGALAIFTFAVVIGVLQGIDVFEEAAIPYKLDQAVDNAKLPVDMRALVSTGEGQVELLAMFLETTFPNFPAGATDRLPDHKFRDTNAQGNDESITETIVPLLWDNDALGLGSSRTVGLSGTWFYLEQENNFFALPSPVLSLSIPYLDWYRNKWTVTRVGEQFLHVRDKQVQPGEAMETVLSDKIYYTDAQNGLRIASLFVDDTPPQIEPQIITGTLGENDWYTSNVNGKWGITDDSPIKDESGCEEFEVTSDGENILICSATSDGGEASETLTIKKDALPPTISGSAAPQPNEAGWNNTDVTVSFDCDDETSGIASCWAPTTLTNDGKNQSISGTATDNAGNSATALVDGINIDKTPPSVNVFRRTYPNAAGWYNSDALYSPLCSDELSSIVSCTVSPSRLSTEGKDQTAEVSGTDGAGNSNSLTLTFNIDKTPPIITGSVSPAANTNGWNNTDVTVSFTCSDNLSGVDFCEPDTTLTSEGKGQLVIGHAEDLADNKNSVTIDGINIDKTAPGVEIVTPPDGAVYVLVDVVNADWAATDDGSGIASVVSTETAGVPIDTSSSGAKTFEVTATDNAGNTTTVTHGYTVQTPAEATQQLLDTVESSSLQKGLLNALLSGLENALESMKRGNRSAALGQVGAFINLIEAQRSKAIDTAVADAMIVEANKILAAVSAS